MKIKELQTTVDNWISEYGVRYFNEMTNSLLLVEEVGEFTRLMARKYGEQSFKKLEDKECMDENIAEELADIIFVLICLANQMNIDLTEAITNNLNKKTSRDIDRHRNNPKLKA